MGRSTLRSKRLFAMREFPRLGVFPGHVDRMVEVQQQAFAAVQETEAKEVVVNKGGYRPQENFEHTESARPIGFGPPRIERRVSVHVVDVVGECGVGMVDESTALNADNSTAGLNRFVHGSLLNAPITAKKQAQLGIRPETAMLNPATEERVLPVNRETHGSSLGNVEIAICLACPFPGQIPFARFWLCNRLLRRVASRQLFNQVCVCFLIRIQTKNPIASRLVDP